MEFYDVIIVGAGPAGLNCAEKLSDNGLKVLVLEKNKKIGPKVCAGGLIGKSYSYLNLPDKLIDRKFKQIIFHTPIAKTAVKLDRYITCTVQRKNLGKWQAGRIKGIEIKTNSKVTEITKDGVVVNNSEKYSYKFLVGADGSYSAVRRYLGLKTKKSGVGLQYLVRTNRFNELEIFLDQKLFGVGYAWIFPYKESASVGCCSLTEKNLKANFEKWLDKMNINVAGAEYGAQCINLNYKGFKFGNVFLTGDAAGLASSITGEGIYEALVSGEEIAKMILDSNYIPEKLNSIIMLNKIRDVLSVIMKHSGLLRVLEFEFVHLLLRNRYIAERLFR